MSVKGMTQKAIELGLNSGNYQMTNVVYMFDELCLKHPDKTAIIWFDEQQNQQQCSFAQLSLLVDKTTGALKSQAPKRTAHVGVYCDKGPLLPAAIIALWRLGLVYVPIEKSYPEKYIRRMLTLAEVDLVITDDNEKDILNEFSRLNLTDIEALNVDSAQEYLGARKPSLDLNTPAILMFTSGSTGDPKGVLHSQRQVLNRLVWMWSEFPSYSDDVAASRSLLSVMPSMWELLGGMLLGLTTAMMPPELVQQPQQFLQVIEKQRISWLTVTPSILRLLLDAIDIDETIKPTCLRRITIGGEMLSDALVTRFCSHFPQVILLEDYGATEVNTIGWGIRTSGEDLTFMPIANVDVVICDAQGQSVANGCEGEIYVCGQSLALGYYNQPDQTQSQFVDSTATLYPKKMYRTGDYGVNNQDGSFTLLGRKDNKVKVNGQAVSLSAIENELKDRADIAQAVVVHSKTLRGHDSLMAWVCIIEDRFESTDKLKADLTQSLPAFMVPHHFQVVESLPKLANGKDDRKSLVKMTNDLKDVEQPIQISSSYVHDGIVNSVQALLQRELHFNDLSLNWNVLGFDSVLIVDLAMDLSQRLSQPVTVTDLFNNPSINKLSEALNKQIEPIEIKHPSSMDRSSSDTFESDDIAVIGMAGQFPGAPSSLELWQLIKDNACSVSEIPESRWSLQDFYDEASTTAELSYSKWGGFIDDVYSFDAARYDVTPNDALYLDPQHRHCFQMIRMTMQDAGYTKADLSGSNVGVFIGARQSEYRQVLQKAGIALGPSAYLGNDNALMAGRLAHHLSIHGPAMVIDTACSSSMVALDLACNSLKNGQSEMAFVGGTSITLDPYFYTQTSALNVFSAKGKCCPFDNNADGFVHGEGVAFVLLKPLAKAQADNDQIYAIIKGTEVNHDGPSNSVAAPNGMAQQALLRQLLQQTKVLTDKIGYIETHGTGTKLGDPIEADAITKVFSKFTESTQRCAIGSIKANIGHLTAAAGVTSLIKAIYCLKYKLKPALKNFEQLNEHISPQMVERFDFPTKAKPWLQNSRFALVSSFGLSGTNGACILQSWDIPKQSVPHQSYYILLSASCWASLKHYVSQMRDYLSQYSSNEISLANVAYTLARREVESMGWLFVATSMSDFITTLNALCEESDNLSTSREKIQTYGILPQQVSPLLMQLRNGQLTQLRGQFETQQCQRIALPVSLDFGPEYKPDADMSLTAVETVSTSKSQHDTADYKEILTQLCKQMLGQGEWQNSNQSLSEIGSDSLKLLALKNAIDEQFGVVIELSDLMGEYRFSDLLSQIEAQSQDQVLAKVSVSFAEKIRSGQQDLTRPMALSELQQSHLISKLSNQGGSCVYMQFNVADLSLNRLQKTWHELVKMHPMLRVQITKQGKQQINSADTPYVITSASEVIDVAQQMQQKRYRADEYPLYQIKVTELEQSTATVHISMDTSIVDAHSAGLLLKQWFALYNDVEFTNERHSTSLSYFDCLAYQQNLNGQKEYAQALEYWSEKLKGDWQGAQLPKSEQKTQSNPTYLHLSTSIDGETMVALRTLFSEFGIAEKIGLYAVFVRWLAQYQQGRDFAIVNTLKNRPAVHPDIEKVVGPFTSSSLFIYRETVNQSFKTMAQKISQQWYADISHYQVSAVEAMRHTGQQKAVGVVYSGLNRTNEQYNWQSYLSEELGMTDGVALHCHIIEYPESIELAWDIDLRQISASDGRSMLQQLQQAYQSLVQPKVVESQTTLTQAPLTNLMSSYLVHQQISGNKTPSYVVRSYQVDDVSIEKVRQALDELHQRHQIMNASIHLKGMQVQSNQTFDLPLFTYKLKEFSEQGVTAACQEVERRVVALANEADQGWPGYYVVCMQQENRLYLSFWFNCLYFDGLSTLQLPQQLQQLLMGKMLPDVAIDSAFQYAVQAQRLQKSSLGKLATQYWQRKIQQRKDADTQCLSVFPVSKGVKRTLIKQLGDFEQFDAIAQSKSVSLEAYLIEQLGQAAGQINQYKQAPILVVDYIHRRMKTQWHAALGDFSSFCLVDGGIRASDVDAQLQQDRAHSFSNWFSLLSMPATKDEGYFPIVFTNAIDVEGHDAESLKCVYVNSNTQGVGLDCFVYRQGKMLCVEWTFVDGFERNITDLFEQFCQRSIPTAAVDESGLTLLQRFNDTKVAYQKEQTMVSIFDQMVEKSPLDVATIDDDHALTYQQLQLLSCDYANHLRAVIGVKRGDVVAVKMPRGGHQVAVLYAILRLGAVFLPLNDNDPAQRQQKMLCRAKASCLIAPLEFLEHFSPRECQLLPVESFIKWRGLNDRVEVFDYSRSDEMAYVIFTSGSTGEPKGVMVRHRPVINLIEWLQRLYQIDSKDRGLWVNAVGFDLSIFDIFGLLGCGASLRIVSNDARKNALLIRNILTSEPITFWNSAPAYLQMVIAFLLKPQTMEKLNLRLIFLSGDWVPMSMAKQIVEQMPDTRLIALGGATETTVWSNYFEVNHVDPQWHSIPYGRPMQNGRYYILDDNDQPCQITQPGRLFIGGECLSDGYINDPEITEKAFVHDPFFGDNEAIMYNTGDLARYFPDGNIEFLGRADTQVKVRGFRVELGEIANVMADLGCVDPVVIVDSSQNGAQVLAGFCLAAPGNKEHFSNEDMVRLVQKLPEYMVPNVVSVIPKYPVTQNGKVDKEALISQMKSVQEMT